jgi:hypothetical protein
MIRTPWEIYRGKAATPKRSSSSRGGMIQNKKIKREGRVRPRCRRQSDCDKGRIAVVREMSHQALEADQYYTPACLPVPCCIQGGEDDWRKEKEKEAACT